MLPPAAAVLKAARVFALSQRGGSMRERWGEEVDTWPPGQWRQCCQDLLDMAQTQAQGAWPMLGTECSAVSLSVRGESFSAAEALSMQSATAALAGVIGLGTGAVSSFASTASRSKTVVTRSRAG
jgi:hypothetical protein